MSKKKVKSRYRLLVVAHPDDETLFFAGPLLQKRDHPWRVICVTNGDADGVGTKRSQQFADACKQFKVKKFEQLGFPDIYEKRLNIKALTEVLQQLDEPYEVYTHGPVGEYGHPHHQDVSFAVHQVFYKKCAVWSPAYNCNAELVFKLTKRHYELKAKVYASIYKGETLRFSNYLPHRTVDEFVKINWVEVLELYQSAVEKRAPRKSQLTKYKWYYDFLAEKNRQPLVRPF